MESQIPTSLVKDSTTDVLQKENLSLCLAIMPVVNDKEYREIQAKFPAPSEYNPEEFVDMIDWVKS